MYGSDGEGLGAARFALEVEDSREAVLLSPFVRGGADTTSSLSLIERVVQQSRFVSFMSTGVASEENSRV